MPSARTDDKVRRAGAEFAGAACRPRPPCVAGLSRPNYRSYGEFVTSFSSSNVPSAPRVKTLHAQQRVRPKATFRGGRHCRDGAAILIMAQIGTPREGTRPTRGRFCGAVARVPSPGAGVTEPKCELLGMVAETLTRTLFAGHVNDSMMLLSISDGLRRARAYRG